MGFYNVVAPCVVGQLHYVRPTTQPIEVDDDVAAPLVESDCLVPYRPGGIDGKTGTVLEGVLIEPQEGLIPPWPEGAGGEMSDAGRQAGEQFAEGVAAEEPETETQQPRRSRRRGTED